MATIRPRIVDYHSPDVETVWHWVPDHPGSVYYLLQIEIARQDEDHGQWFQTVVTTPEALKRRAAQAPVISGRGLTIAADYSWPAIEQNLEAIVSECIGDQWSDVAEKLNRYFWWEFEDHEYLE